MKNKKGVLLGRSLVRTGFLKTRACQYPFQLSKETIVILKYGQLALCQKQLLKNSFLKLTF